MFFEAVDFHRTLTLNSNPMRVPVREYFKRTKNNTATRAHTIVPSTQRTN